MSKVIKKPEKIILPSYFQSIRLIQIFWAVEFTLALIIIQRSIMGLYYQSIQVFFICIFMISIYKLAKLEKVVLGTAVLLISITLFITYFMWSYGGIYDESILAYPCILIMAAMLGNQKLFTGLLIFISCSILLNGYSNAEQWYVNELSTPNINSSLLIIFILLLISYAIWVMSNDFRLLLHKLGVENFEVLKSKQEIEKLLYHDVLTGLPNRVMAEDIFKRAISKSHRTNSKVCLMFLDLDNFKSINDALGHEAGDVMLKELSTRLLNAVRESDAVCRFAGDEFIIIFESVESNEFIANIAQKIIVKLKQPLNYLGNDLTCGCSIGLSVTPNDGTDFDTLVRNADTAMYHSKSIGGNSFHFFDDEMNIQGHDYLNVVSDLRKALKENQFFLVYQPKISLETNKIIGAEALIRWNHPDKGLIFPDFFIPQAEKSGLIVEIGEWVLNQACLTCKSWIEQGFHELSIAVNVSSQQFKRGTLSNVVKNALYTSDLPARHLELEMTESLLIGNSDSLKKEIKYLSNLGITFSIDDFGTGYSNLGYLKDFEIEVLKIDRSFIWDINSNEQNKALVKAMLQLAKGLNLKTVGEGIEDELASKTLLDLGCDYAQGYYWAKPIANEDFIHYVKIFK